MTDVLDEILIQRRLRVTDAREKLGFDELERIVKKRTKSRSFYDALVNPKGISVIAEIKRRSPSAGELREIKDIGSVAQDYEKGGARAISVLTEPDKFGGSVADLKAVQMAVSIPLLEKDFIFDPYQIAEAKANGADAVLLIADMLNGSQLDELVDYARELNVEPLVEIFTDAAVDAVLDTTARLIGINTRNLRTLTMHPENISMLSGLIPKDRSIVAESGIKTPRDVKMLEEFRVKAILVGESLLKQQDLVKATKELVEAGR